MLPRRLDTIWRVPWIYPYVQLPLILGVVVEAARPEAWQMLFFVLGALANQVGTLVGQLALVKLVNIYCAGGLQFGAFAGR